MDNIAVNLVKNYVEEHLDKSYYSAPYEVFILWRCNILQNWKYLISTSLNDGMYYEMTYNGDKQIWCLDVYKKLPEEKKEWYLDSYKKFQNLCVTNEHNE